MGYNLEQEEVSETAPLHLKNASGDLMYHLGPIGEDGEPTKLPVEAVVYGPGSVEHAKASAKRQAANMARLRKSGKSEMSADDIQEDGASFLTAVTVQFNNLVYRGLTGKDLVKAVYMNRKLGFISDQVSTFIGDWENFSKGSATS